MKRYSVLRRFLRNESGETIVEFAIVSTVFFTIFLGIIEFGLIMFTQVAIESATEQVARSSGINSAASTGCADRVCVIKTLIANKTLDLINPQNVIVSSSVITSPSQIPPSMPDICTLSIPPGNAYADVAHCSAFQDNNGDGIYEPPNVAAGNANELVQISVFYTWNVMFPLIRPFFPGGIYKMSSTTVVRNEPYN